MSKYKIGDKFVAEITDLDDSGMGTIYWLNERLRVYDDDLGTMEMMAPVEAVESAEKPQTAHTLDDLRNRVFTLSKLLANAIESYEKVKTEVNGAVDYIDTVINDMGGDSC